MAFLAQLWLPIVVCGFACFMASVLLWTLLPHHRGEWRRLPTEPDVLDALRKSTPPPGLYAFPFAMGADMNRTDIKVAFEKGPIGYLAIARRGRPSMASMMVQMLLYFLIASLLIGYITWHALGPGHRPLAVFRIAGSVAVMTYVFANAPESVWFGRPWKSWLFQLADGVVYGLITAGVFVWMWPLFP